MLCNFFLRFSMFVQFAWVHFWLSLKPKYILFNSCLLYLSTTWNKGNMSRKMVIYWGCLHTINGLLRCFFSNKIPKLIYLFVYNFILFFFGWNLIWLVYLSSGNSWKINFIFYKTKKKEGRPFIFFVGLK